jgi:hypothetical protein
MPAVAAKVLVVVATAFRKVKEVPREQTDRRMFHRSPARLRFQERMTAATGVFVKTLPRRNQMYAVPKQIAKISNLFGERRPIGVGIMADFKKERMPALDAGVFVMTRSHGDLNVAVAQYETGHGV